MYQGPRHLKKLIRLETKALIANGIDPNTAATAAELILVRLESNRMLHSHYIAAFNKTGKLVDPSTRVKVEVDHAT